MARPSYDSKTGAPDAQFEDRLVGAFQKEMHRDARRQRLRQQRPYRRVARIFAALVILGLLGLRAVGINPIVSAYDLLPDQASSRVVAAVNDLLQPTPDYHAADLGAADAPGYAVDLAAFHAGFNMLAETVLWTLVALMALALIVDLLRRRARLRRPSEDPIGLTS